ncbi:L,D-transpeptidase, partial [Mycobacterium malmoense]|uniref:L,D-transpeptidase n=1 Tax=Mycobacterium malmoense TaxID=1780 RepID=UPI0020FFF734
HQSCGRIAAAILVAVGPVTTPAATPHHRPHFGEEGVLPASMGRPEFPTPVGNYTVLSKERSVLMDSSSVGIPVDDPNGYLLNVDYAVRITNRGLFVHSAPWAVPSLGLENVSHGCISLSPDDADDLRARFELRGPAVDRECHRAVRRPVVARDPLHDIVVQPLELSGHRGG